MLPLLDVESFFRMLVLARSATPTCTIPLCLLGASPGVLVHTLLYILYNIVVYKINSPSPPLACYSDADFHPYSG